jgi:hypothetical protein
VKKRVAKKILKSASHRASSLRAARSRMGLAAPVGVAPSLEDFSRLGRDELRKKLAAANIPYTSKLGRGHLAALLWGITTGAVNPDALRAKKLKLADLRAEIDRAMGGEE